MIGAGGLHTTEDDEDGAGGGAWVVVVAAPGVVTPPEPVEIDPGVLGAVPPLGGVPAVTIGLGTKMRKVIDWFPVSYRSAE